MPQQKNEGEGNKTAAREYNQAQKNFVQSGKVEPAAQKAKKAVDSPERADLKKAEDEGRKHSRGEEANFDKPSRSH
jgi:hypothetical protein